MNSVLQPMTASWKRERLMDSRPPIERMHVIAGMLRRGEHVNCSVLERRLEVCRKTLLRDLDFMRDRLRWDIEYDRFRLTYVLRSAPEAVL